MSKLRNVPAALAAAAAPSKSAEPVRRVVRSCRVAHGPVLRVVMYRRGATDEGNKRYSLDAQAQLLRPYITSHPDWVTAGDYVERATGKDVKGRPQLQRLLTDAASGKFDLVLVANIDRWSRNPADLLKTVAFLSEHNVTLRSATEPCDTNHEPVLRVVHYCRVAQDPDEGHQPHSLDAQLQELRACIASHPGWVETGDYLERATAEYVKGRPQLQLLLRDAASGKFDLVLVAGFDRWSRNPADLLNTVTCLSDHTVAFHSATEHFHTTNPVGKMTL